LAFSAHFPYGIYCYLCQRRRLCLLCLSLRWITDFDEISWRDRAWPRDQVIKESKVRNPKSGFTGLAKKYLVDSHQSCIANLHCKNHSAVLLCWRSAEVCALLSIFYDMYLYIAHAQRTVKVIFRFIWVNWPQ